MLQAVITSRLVNLGLGKQMGQSLTPPLQYCAEDTKRESSTGICVPFSAENSHLPKSAGTVGGTSDGAVKNVS